MALLEVMSQRERGHKVFRPGFRVGREVFLLQCKSYRRHADALAHAREIAGKVKWSVKVTPS